MDVLGRSWGINRFLRPVVLHLTLTDRCNLRCRMCNIWRKKERKDISLDIVREIASSKYGRNIKVLDITGGEPFLANIEEIIDIFNKNKLRLVLISTNGIQTDKIVETAKNLLQGGKFSVHISVSLDGTEEYHDRMRGVRGSYEKLHTTVLELKKLQKNNDRLRVGIKMTLMPDNIDKIIPVYNFAAGHGLDFTAKPADVFEFLDNPEMDFSFSKEQTERLNEAFQHIILSEKNKSLAGASVWQKLYHASNIVFHKSLIKYMSSKATGKKERPPAPCLSSFLSIMVHSDGKAYSCPTLMREIGDLAEDGFDAVWNSRRIKNVRNFIRKGRCSCFSQCDQMPSLLMKNKMRLVWLVLLTCIPRKLRKKTCLAYEN